MFSNERYQLKINENINRIIVKLLINRVHSVKINLFHLFNIKYVSTTNHLQSYLIYFARKIPSRFVRLNTVFIARLQFYSMLYHLVNSVDRNVLWLK